MADNDVPDRGGPGGGAEPGSHGPAGDDLGELVWCIGEDVEPPVRILVDDREYIAGAGPPEATLRTDEVALRSVAEGEATIDSLEAAGRWRFEGPDECRQALERSLADWE